MDRHMVLTSKKILRYIFLFIVIPLITLLAVYVNYSIDSANKRVYDSYRKVLSIYTSQTENSLLSAETYVSNIVSNNIAFQSIPSSGTRTMVYSHCYDLIEQSRMMMKLSPMLGAFIIYSQNYDYYYPSYQYNYSLEDQKTIKEYLKEITPAANAFTRASWKPLVLTDRIVLIYSMNYMNTSLSAMLDLSELLSSACFQPELEGKLQYTDSEGIPYTDTGLEKTDAVSADTKIMEPVGNYDIQLIFYPDHFSFLRNLDAVQLLLFCLAVFIILLLPICWHFLQKHLFHPMEQLTASIRQSDNGHLPMVVSGHSCVLEIQQLSTSFNTMISEIKDLKILSYEQKLEIQQAQLQYLQLQIRPHFYLNYMNILFSLAENKNYAQIQDIILSLSQYLRYTFRDIYNMVPLATELAMAENYVNLAGQGCSSPSEIAMNIGENTTQLLIPPFSMLTFLENSIKHSRKVRQPLKIRVTSALLRTGDGTFLNLSIQDNGGGFGKDQLASLNSTANIRYSSEHIGIPNIRHRLFLIYGDAYSLSFFNQEETGCVELFIPVREA